MTTSKKLIDQEGLQRIVSFKCANEKVFIFYFLFLYLIALMNMNLKYAFKECSVTGCLCKQWQCYFLSLKVTLETVIERMN